MSTSIAQNIDALCQEKGVDREIVIEAMKGSAAALGLQGVTSTPEGT